MIKALNKLGMQAMHLNITKATDVKLKAIILNHERLKNFPLRSGIRQGCPLLPLLFNIAWEVLFRTIRQKMKSKASKLERK